MTTSAIVNTRITPFQFYVLQLLTIIYIYIDTILYNKHLSLLGSQNLHSYLVHICGSEYSLMMTPSGRNMSL